MLQWSFSLLKDASSNTKDISVANHLWPVHGIWEYKRKTVFCSISKPLYRQFHIICWTRFACNHCRESSNGKCTCYASDDQVTEGSVSDHVCCHKSMVCLISSRCSSSPWCASQVHDVPEKSTVFLKSPRCSWKVHDVPEKSTMFLKSLPCSWKVHGVPEKSTLFLKSPRCTKSCSLLIKWQLQMLCCYRHSWDVFYFLMVAYELNEQFSHITSSWHVSSEHRHGCSHKENKTENSIVSTMANHKVTACFWSLQYLHIDWSTHEHLDILNWTKRH